MRTLVFNLKIEDCSKDEELMLLHSVSFNGTFRLLISLLLFRLLISLLLTKLVKKETRYKKEGKPLSWSKVSQSCSVYLKWTEAKLSPDGKGADLFHDQLRNNKCYVLTVKDSFAW